MAGRRVDLQTAAELLGITSDAVRKRAKRGKMPYETGVDGKLYVWVDDGRARADTEEERTDLRNNITEVKGDPRDELIATLKEQLEAERNAHAETRRIAYTLAQRVPELEAAQEPPGASESDEGERFGTSRQEAEESLQEAEERRRWWRRLFFGP